MFRRFRRHIKEGFLGVRRHFAMSLSSASAVTITLLLIIIFVVITSNLQEITKNIEGSIKISAIIKYENESPEELKRIESAIRNIDGVIGIEHYTKEEEYQYYLDTYYSEQKELFATYDGENPFHENFMIEIEDGKLLDVISDQIKTIEGVETTSYGGISSQKLVVILSNFRLVGAILVASLCVLAIYLVYNTIKITISARSDEIWIMRNVGAKNGYVRAPFLVEGIIIGILGAIVPILVGIFGYLYLYQLTGGYLISEIFPLINPDPYILYVSLLALGIGIGVGFLGSYLSVCKYLRIRR